MPTIPLHEIIIEDRQRIDLGDVAELANSLKTYGLIQPIILTQDKKLVAGGRRLAAATSLGWTNIDFNYKEVLSQDQLHELELEENIRRKNFSWQEQARCIAKIHRLKTARSLSDGLQWGQRATGELLGIAHAAVHNALKMDMELSDPSSPCWAMTTADEAMKWFINKDIRAAEAELAKRQVDNMIGLAIESPEMAFSEAFLPCPIESAAMPSDRARSDAQERYLSNPLNDPTKFDEYWTEKIELDRKQRLTVPLSSRIKMMDALAFLDEKSGQFDHIITDPPYGIDMDMLNQDGNKQIGIESVASTHIVVDNIALLHDLISIGFDTLKDRGFMVLWCDTDHWEWMKNHAVDTGFAVQRWPFIWCKTTRGKNGAAQYNFTKQTEIAMILRKGNITLATNGPTNWCIAGGNDDMTDKLDHPFAKPFAAWQPLIDAVSHKGQVLCEPFAGSGSGVLSMLRLERHVLACESEPHHYNHLLENLKSWYRSINDQAIFV